MITKRDGRKVEFIREKISNAIIKAMKETEKGIDVELAENIAAEIDSEYSKCSVEQIQDAIEIKLMGSERKDVAKKFITYREKRNIEREKNSEINKKISEVLTCTNIQNQNANVDERSFGGRKNESANILHKDIALNAYIRPEVALAHREARIYIHDLSEYDIGDHNCLFCDIKHLLQNGFSTRNGDVRPANSFSTACQLIAVIFQCQSQVQFGGVASAHLDYDLAPYVKKSFTSHFKEYYTDVENMSSEDADTIINKNEPIEMDNANLRQTMKKAYDYAIKRTEREGKQAAEGLYHNLNTLESRAGSQVPFTSINFGTDTSTEGRMVSKWMLNASISGIGKYHLTPIFPISIFKYKKGINDKCGTPNYDLRCLAEKSLSHRIYPNILNGDFSQNVEEPSNPDTEPASMGCVDGEEVITYRFHGKLFVESFKRFWRRMCDNFQVKTQPDGINNYIDLESVEIFDSISGKFVNAPRAIQNQSSDWRLVSFSDGRSIVATSDHPLPTSRGRVLVGELEIGDRITSALTQYTDNNIYCNDGKAWLLGFILCDGCYATGRISSSIASVGEDDIEEKYIALMAKVFDKQCNVVVQSRGEKGYYKDINTFGSILDIKQYLIEKFGGVAKCFRHIPDEVFSWKDSAKIAFLAGMIDADGYINKSTHGGAIVQIGSTNKELALQQAALARALGMKTNLYLNKYKSGTEKIRYRVEFTPTQELVQALASKKKRDHFIPRKTAPNNPSEIKVVSIDVIDRQDYAYDVTTESDMFDVSGIVSHNCRTMLGKDRHGLGYSKIGRGNICPVTMNLPKIGIKHGICTGERKEPDIQGFWTELDEILALTETALLDRFYHICAQSVKSAPFMYENGTIADAEQAQIKGIYTAMRHGTLAMGYIGIAEMCQAMFGKDHSEDDDIRKFALSVVKRIYDYTVEASNRNDLNFSCYATPAENLAYTYAMALKKEFGTINHVTDREYLTNSHHVPVWQKVSIYKKLDIEAPFCKYATAGCITYIELESSIMQNQKAIKDIIDYAMALNIPYLAFNFPIDTCIKCGYQGEIEYNCPRCGNTEVQRLRRVTGYLTTDYRKFNAGKIKECLDRVKHSKYTSFVE